jgi:hypothetical protein
MENNHSYKNNFSKSFTNKKYFLILFIGFVLCIFSYLMWYNSYQDNNQTRPILRRQNAMKEEEIEQILKTLKTFLNK